MLDAATLAAQVTATLGPAVPYLVGKVADVAGDELRKDALELARGLWARLRPEVEARPAAREAVDDLAEHPTDQDAQAAVRLQLRKVLTDNPSLQEELERILTAAGESPSTSVRVSSTGERSVAIGGNNSGTVSTGDQPAGRPDR